MKKSITALAAIAFVGAISSTAFAGPVSRFDNGYLDEHPEVAQQLAHDPRLVDNPRFLATHPGLDEYFKNHPQVRSDLQSHPDRFMAREGYYDSHHDWHYGHPLATTDHYMDSHPEVSRQFREGPGAGRQSRIRRQSPRPSRISAQSSNSAPRLEVASVPLHGSRAPLRSEALVDNYAQLKGAERSQELLGAHVPHPHTSNRDEVPHLSLNIKVQGLPLPRKCETQVGFTHHISRHVGPGAS